jgi:hypothetical protein
MHWIVLSDSHGRSSAILDILDAEPTAAGFIHLGDLATDMESLACLTDRPIVQVAGNCDPVSDIPRELELVLGSTRVLATHGHLYGVKGGLARLAARAGHRHCQLALYGHTHLPAISLVEEITLVNPGALLLTATTLSYARLHLETDGLLRPELMTL